MELISISPPSFSTHYLRMISFGSDEILSTGTGFIYEYKNEFFLITNGHNITRTNPEQTKRLTKSAGFPVKIKTKTRMGTNDYPEACLLTNFIEIPLYSDTSFEKPLWFVHPDKSYLIDVIAISIGYKDKITDLVKFFPINKYSFNEEYYPQIADDVFILGYPFNITDNEELPIWKRGTIATEPVLDIDNLPKLYIDTASRSGMSGSPVIMQRTGYHSLTGNFDDNTILGRIRNFIGVYSGRIGADSEFKAQLGIVWKKDVIEEIIKAKQIGDIKFQKI